MAEWCINRVDIIVHEPRHGYIFIIEQFIWDWYEKNGGRQDVHYRETRIHKFDSHPAHQLRFEGQSKYTPDYELYLALRKEFPKVQVDWYHNTYAYRSAGYLTDEHAQKLKEHARFLV
jgi:hypothetical protein